jgi:low affinity Fe/Cu permease
MALNQQNQLEADAHRRATAMQAKLDELLVALGEPGMSSRVRKNSPRKRLKR